jgi:hypothetical protein
MAEAAETIGAYVARGRDAYNQDPAIRDAILYQVNRARRSREGRSHCRSVARERTAPSGVVADRPDEGQGHTSLLGYRSRNRLVHRNGRSARAQASPGERAHPVGVRAGCERRAPRRLRESLRRAGAVEVLGARIGERRATQHPASTSAASFPVTTASRPRCRRATGRAAAGRARRGCRCRRPRRRART